MLAALGTRLMKPVLATAFAEAFIDEWNRHARGETAAGAGKRTELAQVERKIANLVDALADGVSRGGAVAAKLVELEGRRDELRQQAEVLPALRPYLHPDLGRAYRDRVAQLREAIEGGENAEAREAARALVDRVVVSPPPEGGGRPGSNWSATSARCYGRQERRAFPRREPPLTPATSTWSSVRQG